MIITQFENSRLLARFWIKKNIHTIYIIYVYRIINYELFMNILSFTICE